MNYNFTDRVRIVLGFAREEAVYLQHDYVGTEHILLGLLREPDGKHAFVLRRAGLTPAEVRERINSSIRHGKSEVSPNKLPYTSRAKKTLEYALAAARDLGHEYVGTEHLLLGLLREEKGIAAQVLTSLGLTHALTEAYVLDQVPGAPPLVETPVFHLSIDDASDRSIYEQIISQVQEGVATGALRPGDRIQPVRQLADELDIAPGTVARAYSELERLGVVVTGGARGTRIAERVPDKGEIDRHETLVGLLRPVAVAAFHLGGTADELRVALDKAMTGIYNSTSS